MMPVAENEAEARPVLPARSIMNGVPSFAWDSGRAVRYEVALEAYSQEIAACTARIVLEQEGEHPQPDVIAACQAAITRLTRERRALDSTDDAAIAAVLDGAAERIAAWRSL